MSQEEKDFEAFVWLLLETIPEEERTLLMEKKPNILFLAAPTRTVEYAGSIGTTILFCLPKLRDKKHSIVRVIYHELAHSYYLLSGKHDPIMFQHSDTYARQCELTASLTDRTWTKLLSMDAERMKKLGECNPLIAIASQYNCAPLVAVNQDGRK